MWKISEFRFFFLIEYVQLLRQCVTNSKVDGEVCLAKAAAATCKIDIVFGPEKFQTFQTAKVAL